MPSKSGSPESSTRKPSSLRSRRKSSSRSDTALTPAVSARRIIVVLFDGCHIMDVAGPVQAFHEARALGQPYHIVFAASAGDVRSAQGLQLAALESLPDLRPGDRVIVPGFTLEDTRLPGTLLSWLRRAKDLDVEIAAVCTGAFLLGEAGLLDGRVCTTHWHRTKELQRRCPRAKVIGDRVFVHDGPIVTSAGMAAGIDMTLGLIERDAGPVVATSVAREMVVYMRREGSQQQESVYVDYRTRLSPGIHRVQQFLVNHPESRSTLAELAALAAMSERHLTRMFRQASGVSLHMYRAKLRLERARHLLHNPTLTTDAVAAASGFSNARQLRRLWVRHFKTTMRARRLNGETTNAND